MNAMNAMVPTGSAGLHVRRVWVLTGPAAAGARSQVRAAVAASKGASGVGAVSHDILRPVQHPPLNVPVVRGAANTWK